jgi:hypothetical protein
MLTEEAEAEKPDAAGLSRVCDLQSLVSRSPETPILREALVNVEAYLWSEAKAIAYHRYVM